MRGIIKRSEEKGFALVVGVILATAIAIFVTAISRMISINSHEAVYLATLQRTHRLAESGMNEALGKLVINPALVSPSTPYTGSPTTFASEGAYQNYIFSRSTPLAGGYYIVTSATRTQSGQTFVCRLHTYLAISNVGNYLAAIADKLPISEGTDASNGDVYAPQLDFTNVTTNAVLNSAQYVTSCLPSPINPALVHLTIGPQPTLLPYPLIFPQVLDPDIQRYQILARSTDTVASNRHNQCDFTGVGWSNIYPPGYENGGSKIAGDPNPNWLPNNNDHVYYCADTLKIGRSGSDTVIHGQILFVSSNSIEIHGSIIKDAATTNLPGHGFVSSSTANECVFITRQSVIVTTDFYNTGAGGHQVETIQALVLAPQGVFNSNTYSLTATHANIKFRFTGSMILGTYPQFANTFQDTSGGTAPRIYAYDTDLRNFPPPYLPVLTNIVASLEEVQVTSSVFGH